jgi:Ca-activated chloride channel homolog
VMAALAQESNGRHYFVANPSGLASVFAQEFDSLVATLARDTEMTLDLAPGVDVEQVFDRAFRREGSKLVIPFGTFSGKQEKTVLMKLRVGAARDGAVRVADVKLTYRDVVKRTDGTCAGNLAVHVTSDGSEQKDVDPFVAARLARSRTSRALTDANVLFEQGRVDEARGLLARQATDLKKDVERSSATRAKGPSSSARAARLEDDFASQLSAVAEAETNFAPPPPVAPEVPADKAVIGRGMPQGSGAGPSRAPAVAAPSPEPANREGKAAVRKNQQNAADLAF